MTTSPYLPVFELTRGEIVESIHYGAIAVVNVHGELLAWFADPDTVTFLRSTAKPFQALPLIQNGGIQNYNLTLKEIAVLCASHSGTDEHVEVIQALQKKVGISESDLKCGVHYPIHQPTARRLFEHKELPTPNRHNCSGKHTGMLALARIRGLLDGQASQNLPYISPDHPIQHEILETFATMCALPVENIHLGIDGCSAPNFAVPLRNAALGFARLCDPTAAGLSPASLVTACQTITSAMMAYPEMVAGPGRFDTRLMQLMKGKIISKGGAEGYQGIGMMPGVLGAGSPAVGIAVKIADGDARKKVTSAVALEVLRQLGALSSTELEKFADLGPSFPIYNWRKLPIGKAYPNFLLNGLQ